MCLRIVLPKVKPETVVAPTRCIAADCGGRKFHLRQEASESSRETTYHEVRVHPHHEWTGLPGRG